MFPSHEGMLEKYELALPRLPGFDMHKWLEDTAGIIQTLSKKSRRNSKSISRETTEPEPMGDNVTTLPFNPEERSLSLFVKLAWFFRYSWSHVEAFRAFTEPAISAIQESMENVPEGRAALIPEVDAADPWPRRVECFLGPRQKDLIYIIFHSLKSSIEQNLDVSLFTIDL